ncbi:MAG: STAS domain-containing protein [Deltaproteobacteria bacterium]|nr:STAS domain-containing protein [Deltaproteobacteria bacterium]
MPIADLESRLQRLNATLEHLLAGEFETIDLRGAAQDDILGRVEETIEFLVMDIKTVAMANRDKEASLLLQQQELAVQQERIEQQARELRSRAETIERQATAIRELSTPILEVWDSVLVLPIIGSIDARRSADITARLLERLARKRTKWVIIDVTGVELVDTYGADHLLRVIRAAKFLGASCLISGVQPAVAQVLAGIGASLSTLVAKQNLAAALDHCLARMPGTQ